MNIINNEFIEIKDKNKPIYIFNGVNNEIFDLVFDDIEKYFKIVRYESNLFYFPSSTPNYEIWRWWSNRKYEFAECSL